MRAKILDKKYFGLLAVFGVVFLCAPLYAQAANPAWWSTYQQYDSGYPLPHTSALFGAGSSATPPLPSYSDIYMQSNTANKIVAMVSLSNTSPPGPNFRGALNWSGPNYTPNTLPAVPAGTPLTLDWACQDVQSNSTGYLSCSSYDSNNVCNAYSSSGTITVSRWDYGSATVTATAGGSTIINSTGLHVVGSMTVTPTQATTYNVTCVTGGVLNYGGVVTPNTPVMSFTVNISDPCPSSAAAAPGNGAAYQLGGTGGNKVKVGGVCVSNSSSYSYFIPNNTAGEIQSFFSFLGSLIGLARY